MRMDIFVDARKEERKERREKECSFMVSIKELVWIRLRRRERGNWGRQEERVDMRKEGNTKKTNEE